MKDRYFVLVFALFIGINSCKAVSNKVIEGDKVKVGAERIDKYISIIRDKSVAIVANQTSMVGSVHLVDTLLSQEINVIKVFAPEHGFRGTDDAGAVVKNDTDLKTGLPIISLYGKDKKPSPEHLEGIDVIVFDIQDVGTRFYTYISTLQLVMESAADNGVEVIVLDRPNPNGHYVDGPVLDTNLRSFVGMNQIPIVHGLTIGEYAMMLVGERWLNTNNEIKLTVVPVNNYSHSTMYQLPVKPSPNLPTMQSIYLYPSLCLFEGTVISVGRGTDSPFEQIGHPDLDTFDFSFKPVSTPGAALNPKYKDEICYGIDLSAEKSIPSELNLTWLIKFYNLLNNRDNYFNSFFYKLSGTKQLRDQITKGLSETEIKNSWKPELRNYKKIRKKYLLYPDFE